MREKNPHEFVEKLNPKSIWLFTKQETDFDEAFKAAKLFNEIDAIKSINVENYFEENHQRYGISTNRHRILIISQLYGLITKTPFNQKRHYKEEKTTEIFYLLSRHKIGSREYNTIKSEQLLKVKIRAIIDTADNNQNYQILPIIFIFKVLKILKDFHNVQSVEIDLLLTYVLTASKSDQVDDAVNLILKNGPIYKDIETYRGNSRILTFIKNNVNLFEIDNHKIFLNPYYEDYFNKEFIKIHDWEEFHSDLNREVDYAKFLYFNQNFNINLIDSVDNKRNVLLLNEGDSTFIHSDIDFETNYLNSVDSVDINKINEKIAIGAHKEKPFEINSLNIGRRYKINPLLGKIAIKNSNYTCEYNPSHKTFKSRVTGQNFMEGHHLIPVSKQKNIWDKYHVNVDCIENIVSLCPNCHRAIHYGTNNEKHSILMKIFQKRVKSFELIGLRVEIKEILEIYSL